MFRFDLNISANKIINYPQVLLYSFTFTIKNMKTLKYKR